VRLQFEFTNNTTEYETCIIGLEAALELKVGKLDVYKAISTKLRENGKPKMRS